MKEVGIRELKAKASELVRRVEEEHATYTISRRGRPVGILSPADSLSSSPPVSDDQAWDRLVALAGQMAGQRGRRKSPLRELARMRE